MTNTPPDLSYEDWLSQLQRLAAERDVEWMIGIEPTAHRSAFDSGLTPDEELSTLADMAEWRGCGCGGG